MGERLRGRSFEYREAEKYQRLFKGRMRFAVYCGCGSKAAKREAPYTHKVIDADPSKVLKIPIVVPGVSLFFFCENKDCLNSQPTNTFQQAPAVGTRQARSPAARSIPFDEACSSTPMKRGEMTMSLPNMEVRPVLVPLLSLLGVPYPVHRPT